MTYEEFLRLCARNTLSISKAIEAGADTTLKDKHGGTAEYYGNTWRRSSESNIS